MKTTIVFLFLVFVSCQKSDEKQLKPDQAKSQKAIEIPKYRNALEVINNFDNLNFWLSENYYPNLTFNRNSQKVTFEFDGQREHSYPVKAIKNKIIVYYEANDEWRDLPNSPKKGKPFIELTLTNDSIISAKYLYEVWIEDINSKNSNYPCFVSKFYSKRL